jgi:hypothetical protein
MPIVTNGLSAIASLLMADAVFPAFNAANAYLGVGDSNAVWAAGQTDLQSVSNKVRAGMNSTYPQRTTNAITFQCTFTTGQANWAWAEDGIFNAASGAASMLTRIVESLGTKTSASTATFTKTLTIGGS